VASGAPIALKFASQSTRLVINDLDAEPAQLVIEAIRALGAEAVACAGRTPKGLLLTREIVMKIEGQERPVMVADILALVLDSDQE